jgi:hypothetical protein
MKNKALIILAKLAEDLDGLGATKVADQVDLMIEKVAQDWRSLTNRLVDDILAGRYGGSPPQDLAYIVTSNEPARHLRDLKVNWGVGGSDFDQRVAEVASAHTPQKLMRPESAPQAASETFIQAPVRSPEKLEAPAPEAEVDPGREARIAAAAKKFTDDTDIDAGPGLENVAKLQQKLIELGYDVGAPQPDGDWGPKSIEAYVAATNEFSDLLNKTGEGDKLAPVSELGMRYDTEGQPYQVGRGGRLTNKERYMSAWGSGNINTILGMLDKLAEMRAQVEPTLAKLTTEEKIKKIASDTKKYASVFWHNSSTPFGR